MENRVEHRYFVSPSTSQGEVSGTSLFCDSSLSIDKWLERDYFVGPDYPWRSELYSIILWAHFCELYTIILLVQTSRGEESVVNDYLCVQTSHGETSSKPLFCEPWKDWLYTGHFTRHDSLSKPSFGAL